MRRWAWKLDRLTKFEDEGWQSAKPATNIRGDQTWLYLCAHESVMDAMSNVQAFFSGNLHILYVWISGACAWRHVACNSRCMSCWHIIDGPPLLEDQGIPLVHGLLLMACVDHELQAVFSAKLQQIMG